MYQDNEKDMYKLKAKGVAKATIEHNLRFEMYEATLFERTEMLAPMDLIRSRSHNLYCEAVRKKTLGSFDDKRYLLDDGLSSLALGHYAIKVGWLVGCFGFNGPFRQYFSLYRAVSQREGERKEKR